MLTVAEAQDIVLRHSRPLPAQPVDLTAGAIGAVLAEDIVSDLDMPPFDKAMMDGYAVRSQDLAAGPGVLRVVEEITAGRTPSVTLTTGQASRIMTGAPISLGADAVVMVEHCEPLDDNRVRVRGPATPGQHIQPRGRELTQGATILRAGAVLRPQEFGLLALVGRTKASIHRLPNVAILATGDELVEPDARPGPAQIRNSNGPMLVAQVAHAGGCPRNLGIARDDVGHLRQLIDDGLRSDMLILSGGVSAGKLDLVPGVLQEAGVQALFHKVRMKPGKPIFFGTRGDALVFGLPGNPVSSFVGFELFVRPALRRLAGHAPAAPMFVPMPLVDDFAYSVDRPTYHPAAVEPAEVGERVRMVPWHGSPDLRALSDANALALLAEGEHDCRAGQAVPVLRL